MQVTNYITVYVAIGGRTKPPEIDLKGAKLPLKQIANQKN